MKYIRGELAIHRSSSNVREAKSWTKIKNVVPLLFTDFIKRNAVLFFSTELVHYSIWSNERQERYLWGWMVQGLRECSMAWNELLDGILAPRYIFKSWIGMYIRMYISVTYCDDLLQGFFFISDSTKTIFKLNVFNTTEWNMSTNTATKISLRTN